MRFFSPDFSFSLHFIFFYTVFRLYTAPAGRSRTPTQNTSPRRLDFRVLFPVPRLEVSDCRARPRPPFRIRITGHDRRVLTLLSSNR